MGCGNSSVTNTSSAAGLTGSSKEEAKETLPDDDEKRKNYGGVYVGLPTDLSNIPQVQIGSLRESEPGALSLRTPLWGVGVQS
ncbi:overexpressed in colon carcinoma 1 protein [Lampris incognitus]|uniref:overexpressed in colon carcinoma 1 protein n=1 Tax=Lampris incognitus TaxID=2546036 RepID=UPI0024B5F944|nr:overexpressed in colon carcinoma 1 protein [Lampris incognitus]XP_056133723.1 overexpressed in colon carcinoma 1 protein [Lampris incognitus]